MKSIVHASHDVNNCYKHCIISSTYIININSLPYKNILYKIYIYNTDYMQQKAIRPLRYQKSSSQILDPCAAN